MKTPGKICNKCKEKKFLKDFGKTKDNASGRKAVCKSCVARYVRERQAIPSVKETVRKRAENYRKNNPEKFKMSVKMATYKKLGITITQERYFELYKECGGLCQICGNPPSGFKKSLALDHSHETNEVRGFLCDSCNTGLGRFKDSPDLLMKAIFYLNKGKS